MVIKHLKYQNLSLSHLASQLCVRVEPRQVALFLAEKLGARNFNGVVFLRVCRSVVRWVVILGRLSHHEHLGSEGRYVVCVCGCVWRYLTEEQKVFCQKWCVCVWRWGLFKTYFVCLLINFSCFLCVFIIFVIFILAMC